MTISDAQSMEGVVGKVIKELGNPVGNDFYLFFKYTRVYHSLPLDLYLYQVFLK